ncbi:MAG TPA: M28 family peptidase [Pyrinomonadaceae bacterium]|nr:M28 family peptidase [Pyrinomonadaceae bacterium]
MSSRNLSGRGFARALLALLACVALTLPAAAQDRRGRKRVPRPGRAAEAIKDTESAVPGRWQAALEQVSAGDMRGHLSFIASDALEGRKTPSRGLDIAAEYIAAQFRRAGLEPAGDDGYFQTADWRLSARDASATRVDFGGTNNSTLPPPVRPEQVGVGFSVAGFSFWTPEGALEVPGAGVVKVKFGGKTDAAGAPEGLRRGDIEAHAIVTEFPQFPRGDQARAFQLLREENDFMARMHGLGARVVVAFERGAERPRGGGPPRVIDPESRTNESPLGGAPTAPLLVVYGAEAARFYDSLPEGLTPAALTVNVPAPTETPVKVRNVAGVLRGSDPALRDTYVIVSAHYDHIGVREGCDASKGDCVNNGANDDGSGTVGVIELASALSKLGPRPKRSILFMTFFGEELGLVGSRYYGRHPLVPLSKTVAQVNMEQIGRTDDSEGPQVGTLAVTGFDFSDVGATLRRAGEAVGVRVYKHPTNSDAYFARSDNQSLADAGVPAHTAGVAFEFPDYHAVGDEWAKVDYANMERVVRAVGLAALLIADDPREPRWNEQNPKTAAYVEAWKKLHGQ